MNRRGRLLRQPLTLPDRRDHVRHHQMFAGRRIAQGITIVVNQTKHEHVNQLRPYRIAGWVARVSIAQDGFRGADH